MKQILLTGFEPFGGASLNSSGETVNRISGDNIVTAILPVSYGRSANELIALVDRYKPDVVICLGQAQSRSKITPERVAINFDDGIMPDNDGVLHADVEIVTGAPLAYLSTLPIKELIEAAKIAGIPASISLTAGSFICNNIFYSMQHTFFGSGLCSGFIHLPLMEEQSGEFPGMPTMPLADMVKCIEVMLELFN